MGCIVMEMSIGKKIQIPFSLSLFLFLVSCLDFWCCVRNIVELDFDQCLMHIVKCRDKL